MLLNGACEAHICLLVVRPLSQGGHLDSFPDFLMFIFVLCTCLVEDLFISELFVHISWPLDFRFSSVKPVY